MRLSKVNEMDKNVNSKLVNENTLYIDKNAMGTIKTNLRNDFTKLNELWTKLYTITNNAVKKEAFAGKQKTAMAELAKVSKKYANNAKSHSTETLNAIKNATDKYEMRLLESRISELEAKINVLMTSQN